jgi:hypothetical protein
MLDLSSARHRPAEFHYRQLWRNPAVNFRAYGLMMPSGVLMLGVLAGAAVFYNIPGVIGGAGEEVGGWFLVIGMMTAYYKGYKALLSAPDSSTLRKTIIGFAIAFCLLAILIPPFFSTDVYCYGNIGWQQVKYHVNPYVHSVNETPNWENDPMFCPEWLGAPSAYGFLFSELTYVLCRLGGGDRGLTALLFKLINVAVFGGTGWLIWRGCKDWGRANPQRALFLFLWNPLILLHFLADGHNDLLMGFCTAACIFCLSKKRWLAAIPLLMTGVSIKYGSVILLPLLLIHIGKRYGKAKAAVGLVLGLMLCGAAAAPYLMQDWRHLALGRIAANAGELRCYTLAAFLYYPFDLAAQLFPALMEFKLQAIAAIKLLLWGGFFAFYLRLVAVRLRGPADPAKLLYDCVLVQFILVCIVSSKFYPWYLGMFLPLVYWLPSGDKLRQAALAVAAAQVLQFTFVRNAHGINTVILLFAPLAYVLLLTPERKAWVNGIWKKLPNFRAMRSDWMPLPSK